MKRIFIEVECDSPEELQIIKHNIPLIKPFIKAFDNKMLFGESVINELQNTLFVEINRPEDKNE